MALKIFWTKRAFSSWNGKGVVFIKGAGYKKDGF